MPSTPVRFPNGVNNAARPSTLQDAGLLDPSKYIVDFEDFHNYAAGDWTVTETQAGATQALSSANGAGGVMLLTNSAADNDVNQLQRAVESFKFVSGKQTWFKCRFKVSDVTQSDVYFGLIITDTDLVGGITDGMYFVKADGAATVALTTTMNSTAVSSSALATLVNDTYVVLGYHYDGASTIKAYVNEVHTATVSGVLGTSICDDEELAVTLSLTNGEAVAKTMAIDYVLAIQER